MSGPDALRLTARQRRELLTAADPLTLPAAGELAEVFAAGTGALVERSAAGNADAARSLRAAWAVGTSALAEALGLAPPVGSARVALDSHLLRLPALATLAADPAAALGQWALVGLREVLGTPVPYPRHPDVDPASAARFEGALVAAVPDTADLERRVRFAFAVTADDVGRWTAAPTPLAAAEDDESGPARAPAPPGGRIEALARLADTFTTVLRAERVVATFHTSPVPLLGGLTYGQALDAGWDADVLTDVVRSGGGRRPVTAAGAAYLLGPDAPALQALARHGQQP